MSTSSTAPITVTVPAPPTIPPLAANEAPPRRSAAEEPPPNPLRGTEAVPAGPPAPQPVAPGLAAGQGGAVPAATPAPASDSGKRLSDTGPHTRSLLLVAGTALLLGAAAITLGQRHPAVLPALAPGAWRRPLPGWGGGVPLSPESRDAVRRRLARRP